jgi:archaetidylinositol phosphate synthase
MSQNSGKPLTRVNRISLGPLERRIIPWLAKRLPAWVLPDHLTILGIFAALLIGLSYWLTRYSLDWLWLWNFALLLHWYADSLDGSLARARHIERERYGFFIDHYCDTIAVFLICLGMGLSPVMDLRIALLLIIGYYAMMTLVYLVSLARDVFKISFAGLGPTEVRLAIVLVNLAVWSFDNPTFQVFGHSLTLFSLCGVFVMAVLSGFYLLFGDLERRKLAQLDPPPSQTKPEGRLSKQTSIPAKASI